MARDKACELRKPILHYSTTEQAVPIHECVVRRWCSGTQRTHCAPSKTVLPHWSNGHLCRPDAGREQRQCQRHASACSAPSQLIAQVTSARAHATSSAHRQQGKPTRTHHHSRDRPKRGGVSRSAGAGGSQTWAPGWTEWSSRRVVHGSIDARNMR